MAEYSTGNITIIYNELTDGTLAVTKVSFVSESGSKDVDIPSEIESKTVSTIGDGTNAVFESIPTTLALPTITTILTNSLTNCTTTTYIAIAVTKDVLTTFISSGVLPTEVDLYYGSGTAKSYDVVTTINDKDLTIVKAAAKSLDGRDIIQYMDMVDNIETNDITTIINNVQLDGIILTSSTSGSNRKFKLKINDSGEIVTEEV